MKSGVALVAGRGAEEREMEEAVNAILGVSAVLLGPATAEVAGRGVAGLGPAGSGAAEAKVEEARGGGPAELAVAEGAVDGGGATRATGG